MKVIGPERKVGVLAELVTYILEVFSLGDLAIVGRVHAVERRHRAARQVGALGAYVQGHVVQSALATGYTAAAEAAAA